MNFLNPSIILFASNKNFSLGPNSFRGGGPLVTRLYETYFKCSAVSSMHSSKRYLTSYYKHVGLEGINNKTGSHRRQQLFQ